MSYYWVWKKYYYILITGQVDSLISFSMMTLFTEWIFRGHLLAKNWTATYLSQKLYTVFSKQGGALSWSHSPMLILLSIPRAHISILQNFCCFEINKIHLLISIDIFFSFRDWAENIVFFSKATQMSTIRCILKFTLFSLFRRAGDFPQFWLLTWQNIRWTVTSCGRYPKMLMDLK